MALDTSAVLFLYEGAKSHLCAKQRYLVHCHLLFLGFVWEIAYACICFALYNLHRLVGQRDERRGDVLSLMVFFTTLLANLRRRGGKAIFIFPNRDIIFSDLGDVSRDCRSKDALIHAVVHRGLPLMLDQL